MKKFILLALVSTISFANEGLEVAKKVDKFNSGFIGESSRMKMTLINAQGDKVIRELSSKISEGGKEGDKSLSIFHKPKDVAGTKMLTWTYKNKSDDQWLFLPSLKRVKRIKSNSKSASFMGSEFSYEDLGSQEVEKYTYKLISSDDKKWVMERFPVKKSGYSKQVVTIAKDTHITTEVKYYNKRKELLKTATFSDLKPFSVSGKTLHRSNKIHMINHLTKKQSILEWSERKLGVKQKDNEFKKEGLSEIFSFLIIASFSSLGASKFSLELGLENRLFADDDNDITNSTNHSFTAVPEFKYKNGKLKFMARAQAQVDVIDSSKNYIYPEDLWLGLDLDDHIFKLGYQVLNWSATEAFHPADVINSRNFDTNLRNAGKLGELMASYKFIFNNSSLFAYFAPLAQKPFFTSNTNQFGFGVNLDSDNLEVILKDNAVGTDHIIPQYGLQVSTQFFGIDFAAHYINHVNRDSPVIEVSPTISGIILTPKLYQFQQFGVTSQVPLESFLFKLEFAHKMFDDELVNNLFRSSNPQFGLGVLSMNFIRDYSQLAIGVEKSINLSNDLELTLLLEAQQTFGLEKTDFLYNSLIFQADTLIGARLAFNDVDSKEVLTTFIIDHENFEQNIFQFSFTQRIANSWKATGAIQLVHSKGNPEYTGLESIKNSDHISITLTKFL